MDLDARHLNHERISFESDAQDQTDLTNNNITPTNKIGGEREKNISNSTGFPEGSPRRI